MPTARPVSLGFLLILTTAFSLPALAGAPDAWREAWENPPAGDRPLQIVHRLDPEQVGRGAQGMASYRDLGLGGIVTNVPFEDYLQSETQWQVLVAGVKACRDAGLGVWLYDELGYPSGSAGGRVLAEYPQGEAQELVFDPSQAEPFRVRPSYEYTHASNNYHAARRYINLLDARAVERFVAVTHQAYADRLGADLAAVTAMFTDEPSLLAINLGQIPEPARSRVRVDNPIDPQVPLRPAVPWAADLPDVYRARYHEDLLVVRRSLFEGDTPDDRRVRRQFWAMIADLVAERYFGTIQNWCHAHGVASSGHCLWEEAIMHHPALVGNTLQSLERMDIPGLDLLSSDPEAVIHSGWLTAALPSSAAAHNGGRRVMTEVSDFSQKMGGSGPAALDWMCAAAAWQAAWGVTEFTLYYSPADRPAEAYRAYGEYVGRLNAALKPARRMSRAALYYPVRDLWAEYRPVTGPMRLDLQSARAQQIVASFNGWGQSLQRNQVPFTLVDHRTLAECTAEAGRLTRGAEEFELLVLPAGAELPEEAARVVASFRQSGGRVIEGDAQRGSRDALLAAVQPRYRIDPPNQAVAVGEFQRDGATLLLVANVGREPYRGSLQGHREGSWQAFDPASGAVTPLSPTDAGIPLELSARQSLILRQE